MSRRTKADAGRGALQRFERAAERARKRAAELEARAQSERHLLRSAGSRLTGSAEALERVAIVLGDDYPERALRVCRLAGEMRAAAAELVADAGVKP